MNSVWCNITLDLLVTCVFSVGYYYELDDSYDESDEEEVRAHLRRVAEQPPLKLDDSAEVKYLANTNAVHRIFRTIRRTGL